MSSQDHAWEMQTYSYRLVEAISLGPGTLPILTSSYRFYFNARMAIFVHRCKCTPIEIKYLGFSRVSKGRDVKE